MVERITYYAIVDDRSSRDHPAGVLRRIEHEDGEHDEAFTRRLVWERSSALYSAERGDTQNDLVPISEEEASRIVERIRQEPTPSGPP
jgi:hypothetical protein